LLFAQFGLSLIIKNKLKNSSFLLIVISLYLPDILLLFLWIYNSIVRLLTGNEFLVNYHLLSHSMLIWSVASVFILVGSIFFRRVKESLIIIGCVYLHLLLDILRPFINLTSYTIYLGISPYHFVNLAYPIISNGILIAIYLPDFIIWIIDFSILLFGVLYFLGKYSKSGISSSNLTS